MSEQKRTYTVRVHDEGEDGLWAEVVELPGCFSSAETWDELREALEEAISLYLSTPHKIVHVTMGEAREVESVKITQQRVLVS